MSTFGTDPHKTIRVRIFRMTLGAARLFFHNSVLFELQTVHKELLLCFETLGKFSLPCQSRGILIALKCEANLTGAKKETLK